MSGRVALVTGAARGIGRGIAERLAAEGAAVVINDVNAAGAEEAVEALQRAGHQVTACPADVASPAACEQLIAETVSRFGGLDLLVNNAGLDLVAPTEHITPEQWDQLHHVDLRAPFLLARAGRQHLAAKRHGVVINIASTHAWLTLPDRSAYAAAKAGVLGLTRALALELGPYGIRVNAVIPGYVETEIWRHWLDGVTDKDAVLAEIRAQHPIGRYGTPADIAAAVAFLASDDAGFITGAELRVDGGHTVQLRPPPVP